MKGQPPSADAQTVPLLEACSLTKMYQRRRWGSSERGRTVALKDVDLTLFPGSTLALVGKSGSGKSTLGRCLALLEKPDAGEIRFRDLNITKLSRGELKHVRQRVQLVWQHSALALNPRFRAVEIVAEPLRIHRAGSPSQRREQALAMMSKLGLPASLASRTPSELSGGQRQRLAIARALMRHPAVIILDEALAGLDLPLQDQVANMLLELKASLSLSYLFISHDLRLAASIADRIAVMQNGAIVECRCVRDLLFEPQQEATRELVNSMPILPMA